MCVLGINSPDTALYESLKLLCSLLVTLVGKGLYGTNGSGSDVRFIDQGTFFSHALKIHRKDTNTLLTFVVVLSAMLIFFLYLPQPMSRREPCAEVAAALRAIKLLYEDGGCEEQLWGHQ